MATLTIEEIGGKVRHFHGLDNADAAEAQYRLASESGLIELEFASAEGHVKLIINSRTVKGATATME